MNTNKINIAGLSESENELLIHLLEKHFPKGNVTCYLFGSSTRNDMVTSSDIDLFIISDSPLRTEVSLFREALDESNIIRKVDVIWHEDAPESLLKNVTKEGTFLWKN